MTETQQRLFNCGIVPVIKLDDAKDAVPLCNALESGGLDVAEITFRTDAAEESIKRVSYELENVFVGAGTVLNIENAKKAISAGAKFIVSPGFNEKVVEYCLEQNVPVLPGISTPSEIEKGISYGLDLLKFFPAEANGGLASLKAMAAPYSMVKFMPTGGISPSNIVEYLSFDKIIACGGTWMIKDEAIKSGHFTEITKLATEAVATMHNFKFFHMAINEKNQSAAIGLANIFSDMLNTTTRETSVSAFAGNEIEIMGIGDSAKGEKGHIAFKTTNVPRAIKYFEKRGIELDYNSIKLTNNVPTFIYFKNDLSGFAVHLIQ